MSESIFFLSNVVVQILTSEHRSLSLLCVMGKGSSADKKMLIDYNVDILHDALSQIFKV